jgi:hypothetical protein
MLGQILCFSGNKILCSIRSGSVFCSPFQLPKIDLSQTSGHDDGLTAGGGQRGGPADTRQGAGGVVVARQPQLAAASAQSS